MKGLQTQINILAQNVVFEKYSWAANEGHNRMHATCLAILFRPLSVTLKGRKKVDIYHSKSLPQVWIILFHHCNLVIRSINAKWSVSGKWDFFYLSWNFQKNTPPGIFSETALLKNLPEFPSSQHYASILGMNFHDVYTTSLGHHREPGKGVVNLLCCHVALGGSQEISFISCSHVVMYHRVKDSGRASPKPLQTQPKEVRQRMHYQNICFV